MVWRRAELTRIPPPPSLQTKKNVKRDQSRHSPSAWTTRTKRQSSSHRLQQCRRQALAKRALFESGGTVTAWRRAEPTWTPLPLSPFMKTNIPRSYGRRRRAELEMPRECDVGKTTGTICCFRIVRVMMSQQQRRCVQWREAYRSAPTTVIQARTC